MDKAGLEFRDRLRRLRRSGSVRVRFFGNVRDLSEQYRGMADKIHHPAATDARPKHAGAIPRHEGANAWTRSPAAAWG
jgi:hypothetical protein